MYIFTSRREITFPFAYVFFHFSFVFLYSTILVYSHSLILPTLILHHSLPLSHSIPSQQHIACVPDLGLPRDHCVGTETVEDTRHLSTHIPQLGRREGGRGGEREEEEGRRKGEKGERRGREKEEDGEDSRGR